MALLDSDMSGLRLCLGQWSIPEKNKCPGKLDKMVSNKSDARSVPSKNTRRQSTKQSNDAKRERLIFDSVQENGLLGRDEGLTINKGGIMAKDRKDQEKYTAGISGIEGSYAAKQTSEPTQEYPIASLDEPLVGWYVAKASEPMPEILMINGVFYQKLKVWRYAE